MIGIVIPTVDGREQLLETAIRSLESDGPTRIWVARGYRRCGDAWNAGAHALLADPLVTHIMFCADDLEARPGWAEAAIAITDHGELPAAAIHTDEGLLNGEDGPDGAAAWFPRVPFFTCAQYLALDEEGRLPSMHYYTDMWFGDMAARAGIVVRRTDRFAFHHHRAQPGRIDDLSICRATYQAALARLT